MPQCIPQERRVAIYARTPIDTPDLDYTQKHLSRCKSYAKEQGWTVVRDFSDVGGSGATLDRPGLKLLLATVDMHEVDVVLVSSVDRLSHDISLVLTLHSSLKRAGVELHALAIGKVEPHNILDTLTLYNEKLEAEIYRKIP